VTIKLRRFEGSKTNGRIRAMSMQLQNCTIKNVQPLTFNKEIDSLSFGSDAFSAIYELKQCTQAAVDTISGKKNNVIFVDTRQVGADKAGIAKSRFDELVFKVELAEGSAGSVNVASVSPKDSFPGETREYTNNQPLPSMAEQGAVTTSASKSSATYYLGDVHDPSPDSNIGINDVLLTLDVLVGAVKYSSLNGIQKKTITSSGGSRGVSVVDVLATLDTVVGDAEKQKVLVNDDSERQAASDKSSSSNKKDNDPVHNVPKDESKSSDTSSGLQRGNWSIVQSENGIQVTTSDGEKTMKLQPHENSKDLEAGEEKRSSISTIGEDASLMAKDGHDQPLRIVLKVIVPDSDSADQTVTLSVHIDSLKDESAAEVKYLRDVDRSSVNALQLQMLHPVKQLVYETELFLHALCFGMSMCEIRLRLGLLSPARPSVEPVSHMKQRLAALKSSNARGASVEKLCRKPVTSICVICNEKGLSVQFLSMAPFLLQVLQLGDGGANPKPYSGQCITVALLCVSCE